MPLLVQEQRFLAAAVEHERVAPFQPDDSPSLAGFLSQQKADRILVERLRRRRSDVDQLRAGLREAQQPSVDAMVVDDDVRCLKTALPADADERRIAGAGTDDVDTRSIHSCPALASRLRPDRLQQLASALCIQCGGEPAGRAHPDHWFGHSSNAAPIASRRAMRRWPSITSFPSCSPAKAPSGS